MVLGNSSGSDGRGGGSDTPSTDVSWGTLYAGIYFLRDDYIATNYPKLLIE